MIRMRRVDTSFEETVEISSVDRLKKNKRNKKSFRRLKDDRSQTGCLVVPSKTLLSVIEAARFSLVVRRFVSSSEEGGWLSAQSFLTRPELDRGSQRGLKFKIKFAKKGNSDVREKVRERAEPRGSQAIGIRS